MDSNEVSGNELSDKIERSLIGIFEAIVDEKVKYVTYKDKGKYFRVWGKRLSEQDYEDRYKKPIIDKKYVKLLKEKLQTNSWPDCDAFTGREIMHVNKAAFTKIMNFLEEIMS